MIPHVVIDGVAYVPVSESNPNAEQIARGIMEQFWGELPEDTDWKEESNQLFVRVQEEPYGNPSVMQTVEMILKRTMK